MDRKCSPQRKWKCFAWQPALAFSRRREWSLLAAPRFAPSWPFGAQALIPQLQGLLAPDSPQPSALCRNCFLPRAVASALGVTCTKDQETKPSALASAGPALQGHPAPELPVGPAEASVTAASRLSSSLCPLQLPAPPTGASRPACLYGSKILLRNSPS